MKMPSKVPAEIDMDDSDIEIPEEAMMPQQKSYLWATDLQGKFDMKISLSYPSEFIILKLI